MKSDAITKSGRSLKTEIESTQQKIKVKIDSAPKLNNPIPEDIDLTEILCLTTYPPRQCGIATYSQDLHNALEKTFGDTFKFTIYPLVSQKSQPVYPKEIQSVLNTDYVLDFLQAAYYINSNKK